MLPYGTYLKAILLIGLVCGIFFAGWHTRDRDFTIYKDQVRIAAEKQQAHTESVQKQQELINKGIQNEYDAKLAFLRQYFVFECFLRGGSFCHRYRHFRY